MYQCISSPRPPLPLSATLSEPEAAIIIQACAKGFIVSDHVTSCDHTIVTYYRTR